jgi:toluene monooxygenase electron transfer component
MMGPGARRVTLDPSGASFEQAPGQRLLEAAREAGVWLPFECGWGSCGTCKATLVSGDVELLVEEVTSLSERDARRGRIVLCQSSATTDVVVKPLRVSDEPDPLRPVRVVTGRVRAITEVGPAIFDITVDTEAAYGFRPGQFAIVHGPQDQRRCYSFAGAPGESHVRFVVKQYAGRPVSTWVSSLTPGTELTFEGPYGDVWLRASPRPLLMIAGGSGISAVLGLVREAASHARDRDLTVLYGARTMADLALLGELTDLVSAHGRGRLIPVVESGPGAVGALEGRVTDPLEELDCAGSDVYLAGPPAMVDAVDRVLLEHGASRDRLHVDRFG